MLKDRVKTMKAAVKRRVKQTIKQAAERSASKPRASALAEVPKSSEELEAADEALPVVARLVVEIRSDGSRTVARGAMKDELGGEQVSVVARGDSPLELAAQLTKSLVTMPLTAGQLAKAMLNARRQAEEDDRSG
jgi:hypothetical protein